MFYQFLFYISTYISASMNKIQFVAVSKILYKWLLFNRQSIDLFYLTYYCTLFHSANLLHF